MSDWEGQVLWRVEQFDDLNIDDYVTPFARWLQAKGHPWLLTHQWAKWEKAKEAYGDPDKVIEVRGNILLNEGINEMWQLIAGAGGTAYNNANARLLVGNHADNTTNDVAAANTALSGPTTTATAMDATYPQIVNQTITFKMTTAAANHQWNEWSVDNGSGANKNMNKKIESLGTKTTGTWTLTAAITLA